MVSITHNAVRSDGSVSAKHTWSTGLTEGNIWDRSLRRHTKFYPDAQAKVTEESDASGSLPDTECTAEMLNGSEAGSLLGYRVLEYREKVSPYSESIVQVAPDLGCAPLYTEQGQWTSEGEWKRTSITKVHLIVENEPDHCLFTVPSHYVEMPLSEARRKAVEAMSPRILP
jgi:hypothetical protein